MTRPDGEIVYVEPRRGRSCTAGPRRGVLGRQIFELVVPAPALDLADEVMSQVVAGRAVAGRLLGAAPRRRHGACVRDRSADRRLARDGRGRRRCFGGCHRATAARASEPKTSRSGLALALEAGGFGTWRWDMATGVVEWDAKLEQLFGLEPGEFDGTFDAYVALLHPDDRRRRRSRRVAGSGPNQERVRRRASRGVARRLGALGAGKGPGHPRR